MKKINVLGCMSGTSMDGIDFAICQVSLNQSLKGISDIKLIDGFSVKMPKRIDQKLILAASGKLDVPSVTDLHFELGRFYADTLAKLLDKHKTKIDLIGLHGQTVYHNQGVSSLQICEPSFIARKLKKPVVSDFRAMHIAAGGLGAPIANFFHQFLFSKMDVKAAAFQNIGGIANVTYLEKNKMIAFDTGPGNMLIDGFMKTLGKSFDKDGRLALKGTPQLNVVNSMLRSKIFDKENFGREQFGESFLKKLLRKLESFSASDKAATISELTVKSIVRSYERLPSCPETVVLCGGGARNGYVVDRLKFYLKDSDVVTSESIGWPVEMVEPAAIAMLAVCRYYGIVVKVCGKGRDVKVLLGKLT